MLPNPLWLRCPDDGAGPLFRVPTGVSCPHCGRTFPEADGILSLLPAGPAADPHAAAAVQAERAQRDQEARLYDRLLGLRFLSLFELPATLGPLRLRPDDQVVEVGCGTGRFTLPLAERCARVLAIDHSLESLRVLKEKLPRSAVGRVSLIQADASRLPLAPGWATAAVSCQMLEHLPTAPLRAAAIAEMARVLPPGGRLAISGYWYAPWLRLLLAREGLHGGTIFFHRFHQEEFEQLLRPYFRVERLSKRLVYVLLAHGRRNSTPLPSPSR